MEELIKILSLDDDAVLNYVKERISELDFSSENEIEVSLGENEGEIYRGWLNTNTTYLPSGNRSKGFKMTEKFYLEWVYYLRNFFKSVNLESIKQKFDNERLVKLMWTYSVVYFGGGSSEDKRKEIFGYGKLNSIGKSLPIDSLKNENVARCSETSASLNGIANFMGIDSSLILSYAKYNDSTIGHAYCLIRDNETYKICDPNFTVLNNDGKTIYFIFDININGKDDIVFDAGEFGDKNQTKVEYMFPWNKFNNLKR